MPEARVDLDVVRAAHRVDRAVAAGDGAELRLGGAQRHLVAPVEPLLVRRPRPPRAGAARRRTRRPGRRTGATSCRSASGAQVAVRVGERDDLATRSRARRGPARPPCRRAGSRITRAPAASASSSVAVGRGVGGDDDLEPVGAGSRARAGSRPAARSPAPRCGRRRSP